MSDLTLEAKITAVVLIDLQHAIVGRTTAPHASASVVQACANLADRFRAKGATIVFVHVDLTNMVKVNADKPTRDPNAPPPPAKASEIVPETRKQPSDLVVAKRFWDAFVNTDLEQKLRERNIRTIILGGISTNFGVESTARTGAALGFEMVLLEDAMTSMDAAAHRFAVENILPRLGRVRASSEVHPA
jgi:nicotinamidase-related amidase